MTARHTNGTFCWEDPVAVLLLFLIFVPPALAQDELIGPSPILPVDVGWVLDLGQSPTHPPAFDDAHVYIPLRDGTLLALLLRTGQHVWTRHRPVDQAPVAGDGLVIVSNAQQLIGVRSGDGRLLWTQRLSAPIIAPLQWTGGWLTAALADGKLVAFRGFDGSEVWRRDLGAVVSVKPTIAGDRIYLSLKDGRITVLELATGTLVWERKINGTPQQILPLDAVFVGSTDNFFYRLSLADGREEWHWRTGGDIIGAPAVDEERVYFASLDNIIRALDRRSGVQQWRRPLAGRPSTGPILVDTALVMAGLSPVIQLYDTESGQPSGEIVASDELAAPPHRIGSTDEGAPRLALVTGDGEVMVLEAATGPRQIDPRYPVQPILAYPKQIILKDAAVWYPLLTPASPPNAHARRFTVEVRRFRSLSRAEALLQQLSNAGYPAFVLSRHKNVGEAPYRIHIGRSLGHGDASKLIERLTSDKLGDFRTRMVDQ